MMRRLWLACLLIASTVFLTAETPEAPLQGFVSGPAVLPLGGLLTTGLNLQGGVTNDGSSQLLLNGSVISTGSADTISVHLHPTLSSTGTSANADAISGVAILGSFAANVNNLEWSQANLTISAAYLGTPPFITFYEANHLTLPGGYASPLTVIGYQCDAGTFAGGNTSGHTSNICLNSLSTTASAGVGGTLTNDGAFIGMPAGTGVGTTNNGILISGNGGGGGATNFAINDLSTAPVVFTGPTNLNGGVNIGVGPPPTIYVALPVANGGTGNDANNCLSAGSPCATLAHARDLFVQYDLGNQSGTINIGSTQSATITSATQSGTVLTASGPAGQINVGDIVTCTDCPIAPTPLKVSSFGTGTGGSGTYNMNQSATFGPEAATTFTPIPGAQFSGALRGAAGGGISGQYLTINGAGSGSTYVGVISGKIFSLEFSNGFNAIVQNMSINAANNKYGIFGQNPGTVVQLGAGLNCIGDGTGAICAHVEASALMESAATNTINFCGSWNHIFTTGSNAELEFDPGGAGVLNACSTSMTWSDVFNYTGQSNIVFPSGWTMTGFSATGGKTFVGQDGAVLNSNSCLNNSQITGTTPNIYQAARCSPATPPTQSSTPTGCGTACAITLAAGSGEHGGYISLATDPSGAGTFAGTGNISMTRAVQFKQTATIMAPCQFALINEGGSFTNWPAGSVVLVTSSRTSGGITATWDTRGGGNLASNSTYAMSYICQGDR